jgi:EAL domain-containing protein (putative c-di-GMP-specific phosphodiesterase class I)/GGDEF domain-containing protein
VYIDIFNDAQEKIGEVFIDENLASKEDIAKLQDTYTKKQHASDIDMLTDLPVRSVLMRHLLSLQSDAMLLIINLNFFSQINDFYGRDIADTVLLQKADEYKKMIGEDAAFLFRLNVSEFAVLVEDSALFEKYQILLEHYILTNNECFIPQLNNQKIIVSQTVGVAYGNDRLLSMADIALKSAISSNLKYCTYDENIHSNDLQRENFEDIRIYKDALEDGRIYPFFQPIVRSSDEQIVKYEALARIIDEDGNIISPYKFLKAAKNDKSSEFFTRQILQKIFTVYGKNEVDITVNLTYENINTPSLIEYIRNRLELYGGERLTFEIIESEDIQDYQVVEEFIMMAKRYGCKIAIDDFGSGYSNFTNIIKINTDYIKLDGTLIKDIETQKSVELMVKSLISFAKEAGIELVAEFISSKEIAQKVKSMGVEYLQGFLYGKPEQPQFYGLKN